MALSTDITSCACINYLGIVRIYSQREYIGTISEVVVLRQPFIYSLPVAAPIHAAEQPLRLYDQKENISLAGIAEELLMKTSEYACVAHKGPAVCSIVAFINMSISADKQ